MELSYVQHCCQDEPLYNATARDLHILVVEARSFVDHLNLRVHMYCGTAEVTENDNVRELEHF
jgi:hypothetical protein